MEQSKEQLQSKKAQINNDITVKVRGRNVILSINGDSVTKVIENTEERKAFYNDVKALTDKPIKKNIESAKRLFTVNSDKAKEEKATNKSVDKANKKGKISSTIAVVATTKVRGAKAVQVTAEEIKAVEKVETVQQAPKANKRVSRYGE